MRISSLKENITNVEDERTTEYKTPSPKQSMAQLTLDETDLLHSDHFQSPQEDVDVLDENLTQSRSLSVSEEQKACLTVQPNRILCGVSIISKTIFQDTAELRC